jgi:glutamate synthase (NADPH/NADH) small chain
VRAILEQLFIRDIRKKNIVGLSSYSFNNFINADIGRIQNTFSGEVEKVKQAYRYYFMAVQYALFTLVYISMAFLSNPQFAVMVVIGGGDTGSDCVGTSNRQGAASITQFELLPKPPNERAAYMPWPTYPMLLKTTTSHEEGVERIWEVATKAFIGDEQGNLKALQIIDLEWSSAADGRPASFKEKEGSIREIPCEAAFLAMGFLHPQQKGLLEELGVELDERGNVKATEAAYQTSVPKIFTAGDMRRGQSLVVWAISEGRECARKVDIYLTGSSLLESKDASLLIQQI